MLHFAKLGTTQKVLDGESQWVAEKNNVVLFMPSGTAYVNSIILRSVVSRSCSRDQGDLQKPSDGISNPFVQHDTLSSLYTSTQRNPHIL